jgi:hypothetical protein
MRGVGREIFEQVRPCITRTGLADLFPTDYNFLDLVLLLGFANNQHEETNNFHNFVGEMTVTLDNVNVSYLPHLSIKGHLLDHIGNMFIVEIVDMKRRGMMRPCSSNETRLLGCTCYSCLTPPSFLTRARGMSMSPTYSTQGTLWWLTAMLGALLN